MVYQFFDELKIPIIVKINSIGCPKCREKFLKVLKDYLKKINLNYVRIVS